MDEFAAVVVIHHMWEACGITGEERVKGKTICDAVVRRNPSTLLMELQIICGNMIYLYFTS
jgi:hypothetical protein